MTSPPASTARLARFGFRQPERSARELPDDWSADPRWDPLLAVIGQTPEPDAALRRLGSLGPDVTTRALQDPRRAAGLVSILGFSEYLTQIVGRIDGLALELLGHAPVDPPELRDHRDASVVRIAADDLSETPTRASFERAGRSLADLADSCVARALDEAGGGLAVMAMGKYGGRELNYASDIDVLFVAAPGSDEREPVARALMARLNGPPTIFRTDADLRPQGRDGPLVRSLDAFAAYYKRWAEVWEFQSLIKCRFAAGDEATGRAFLGTIQPFVWPEQLGPDAIEQVRALKSRAEREVTKRGLAGVELKLGPGGIRDVEFAVQLLQLVHGRHRPELRSANTLEALETLGAEGFVDEEDAAELADAYVLLRHTEHRVQLRHGRQTHTLPSDPGERELIARSLALRDLAEFEDVWRRTTAVVRRIHERLFYRPLLEAFTGATPAAAGLTETEADERLAALGYDRPPRVRAAITEMTAGSSRRAKVLRAILPGMLAWMAETPDPDAGMIRLASIAHGLDSLPHLLGTLRDEPPVAELLCRALGTGPVLGGLLERDPTLIGALEVADETEHREHFVRQAVALTGRTSTLSASASALRRFKDGELLRLAVTDLLGGADARRTFPRLAAELSDVADACVQVALQLVRADQASRTGGPPPGGFAVIALGRYGGRELSYASDLDVVFVYEKEGTCPDGSDGRLFHAAVAEGVIALLGSTPPIFKVDTELRPEGRKGPIVRSIDAYEQYYQRWASLWEFQALTRARHAAGDEGLTDRLKLATEEWVWRPTLGPDEINEIRQMKARIERERVKGRDPRYEVKLGTGGLADVEFTVQLLQMLHGHEVPSLRRPNTLEALTALREEDLVDEQDATWLGDAYLLLNRVRNHMFLLRGLATDSLPERDEELERLARSLGYGRLRRTEFLEHYRRVTRRARQVCDRLFYGEEPTA